MSHATSALPGNGPSARRQTGMADYVISQTILPSSDPISISPEDHSVVLSQEAISSSPSEFMEACLSKGLKPAQRLDVWKEKWRAKEEMRPEPRIPHPGFPQALVRCRSCNLAKGIMKKMSRKPGSINESRSYFICERCAGRSHHNNFICWADLQGVSEENGRCECGYPMRKQVTNSRHKTKGVEFVTRAFGTCGLWDVWYRWEYELLMCARSNMSDAIFAVHAPEELSQVFKEMNKVELPGRT